MPHLIIRSHLMPLEGISLPRSFGQRWPAGTTGLWPSQNNHPSSAAAIALVRAAVFQFICEPLYLFFPRDIHDSFGVVEKTVAQEI